MQQQDKIRKSIYISREYREIVNKFEQKYGNDNFSKEVCKLIEKFIEFGEE